MGGESRPAALSGSPRGWLFVRYTPCRQAPRLRARINGPHMVQGVSKQSFPSAERLPGTFPRSRPAGCPGSQLAAPRAGPWSRLPADPSPPHRPVTAVASAANTSKSRGSTVFRQKQGAGDWLCLYSCIPTTRPASAACLLWGAPGIPKALREDPSQRLTQVTRERPEPHPSGLWGGRAGKHRGL